MLNLPFLYYAKIVLFITHSNDLYKNFAHPLQKAVCAVSFHTLHPLHLFDCRRHSMQIRLKTEAFLNYCSNLTNFVLSFVTFVYAYESNQNHQPLFILDFAFNTVKPPHFLMWIISARTLFRSRFLIRS